MDQLVMEKVRDMLSDTWHIVSSSYQHKKYINYNMASNN